MESALKVALLVVLLSGMAAGDIDWSRLVQFGGKEKSTTTTRATTTTTTKAPVARNPKVPGGDIFDLADALGPGAAETPSEGDCVPREMIQQLSEMMVEQRRLMKNLVRMLCRNGRCVGAA